MIQMMRFVKVEEGEPYPVDPLAAEDEWIVGTDPYRDSDFVVHRLEPRFIAEYMICDADNPDERGFYEAADYKSNDVAFLTIQWIDPEPPAESLPMDQGGDGEPGVEFWLESAEYAIKYSLGLPLDHLLQPEEDEGDESEEVGAE